MANEVAIANTKANPVVAVLRGDRMQAMVQERLGKRAGQFTTSLISLVNANEKIAACEPMTVIQAALTAAAMDLPINQNLGFAYIIPYGRQAQFQMGYKGFIQLAQRSGKFQTINTTDVREGEVKSRDRMTGELAFNWIDDDKERNDKPIVGYLAYFELLNGFKKSLYMTKAQIEAHATRFSQSYKGKYDSPWKSDFDLMAQKTALKLLLSRFAPLSTEMQEAITSDQSVSDGNTRHYIDNDDIADVGATDDQKAAIISANKKPATNPGMDADKSEDGKKAAPKKSVKERADEWAKKGIEKNHQGEQASLVDDENTGQDT